jgi:hypothetical protein
MTKPDDPLDSTERSGLFRRIMVRVYELNTLLLGAAMSGDRVNIDVVDRRDCVSGNEYSEIVVSGQVENDAG